MERLYVPLPTPLPNQLNRMYANAVKIAVAFLESMGLPKSKLSATRKQVESGKLSFKDEVEYKMYSRHERPSDYLESDKGLERGSEAEK